MALEVNDANFEELVLQSDKLVVVDFWAEWCGPCRIVAPIVEELSQEYAGRLVVAKVDVDSNPGTASKYGIRNIPTLLFIKGGQVIDKHVGAAPKTVLASKVESLL
ncbi:MAG: thioredoxin [Prolixibacteraceae bacterium]|jgi:thioredoxin 1|nr:thioredoxin [Prolixibacteraceae bacterium]